MKKRIKFILITIALLSSMLTAQDEFSDVEENPAGEDKKKIVIKDPSEMNLNELQEYQKFVYVPGGRDPFVFRIPEIKKGNIIQEQTDSEDTLAGKQTGMPTEKEQEEKMDQSYRMARNYLMASSYPEAIDIGDEAQKTVEKWGGLTSLKAQRMFERIVSLKQTAIRLLNKREITKKFNELPILINGIRVSDTGAAALVNDNIVEVGMTLTLENGEELQVDRITKNGVIFSYNGLKLKKEIGEDNSEE